MGEIIKMGQPILFTITSDELAYAENQNLLSHGKGVEYWWDAVECTHPGYPALREYCQRRQRGRLVRLLLSDGTPDPAEVYVHWFNVPDGCGAQYERIEWSQGMAQDTEFEKARGGHGEFIYLRRNDGFPASQPESFFVNWEDFPQLHHSRVLFCEGIPVSWWKAKNFQ